MGDVNFESRFPFVKQAMVRAATRIMPKAGDMVNTEAQRIIEEKDFIVSGNLRRTGYVSRPQVLELHGPRGSETTVRVTISYPMAYAKWIETGIRTDPRFGKVTMHNPRTRWIGPKGHRQKVFIHGEPGFLHEAMVHKTEDVAAFIKNNLASAFSGLETKMAKRL